MPNATPPNFLVLVSEDVGIHHGCYGNPHALTPNIDQLASEGLRFTQAYTTFPVCSPSRSTIVTGQYPYALGTHLHRCVLRDPPRLFTHELQDAGYHVAWPTKLDFNFTPSAGWCTNTEPWWEQPPPTPPDKPFFLFRNFSVTHESSMWRTPEEQARATPDVPNALRLSPDDAPVPDDLPDCPEVRHQQALYYDSLTQADHEIGQCLNWLDDHNLRDNTIVVYLSDHGSGLPRNKRWCYDPGIHMPLIIRLPNTPQFADANSRRATHARPTAGTTRDTLVSWIDLAPTILTLAGTPIPDHYHGQSFLNPNGSPPSQPRTTAFGGRDRMDAAFDHVRYVKDIDYLYIRNSFPHIPYAQRNAYMEQASAVQAMREAHAAGRLSGGNASLFQHPKPPEELYRPADDPYCIHNLINDPTHQNHANRLRDELETHLKQVGDLGTTDEADLVAQGLIEDQIDAMRQRISPLPDHLKLGPDITAVTSNEAIAEAD